MWGVKLVHRSGRCVWCIGGLRLRVWGKGSTEGGHQANEGPQIAKGEGERPVRLVPGRLEGRPACGEELGRTGRQRDDDVRLAV